MQFYKNKTGSSRTSKYILACDLTSTYVGHNKRTYCNKIFNLFDWVQILNGDYTTQCAIQYRYIHIR